VTAATDTELADWDDDAFYPQDSDFGNDMDLVATGALAYASSLMITGNVFNDVDGLTDNTVDGLGTNTASPLFAILVDNLGDVVDCVPVSPDGLFILGGALPNTTYTVILSTTSETAGNPAPSPSISALWVNTGEHLGAGPGDDGTVDGSLSVPVVTSNVTQANFGIQLAVAVFTIDKTVDPTSVSTTGTVTYTVVVVNTGNMPLTGVVIVDTLEPDVTPGSAVESMTDDDILEVGETWTWTYDFTITQSMLDAGDPIPNTATVSVIEKCTFSDDAEVTITLVPDPSMTLMKTGTLDRTVVPPNNQANPGDEIHYTFTVTNTGNVTLFNINVTDTMVTVIGGPLASLAPGDSDSVTFTGTYVLTPADINAGEVINSATATATPPGADVISAEDTAQNDLTTANINFHGALGGEAFSVDKLHLIMNWVVEALGWLVPTMSW
jgi:uncharacterized repeat protein (TIGR01451 family)